MKIFKNECNNYTLYGLLFGLCFPIGATILQSLLTFDYITLQTLWKVQRDFPLLWIIDSAPIFLGIFARIGGRRQDDINFYNKNLESRIAQRTQQLLTANEELRLTNKRLKDSMQTLTQTQNQLVESEKMKTASNLILTIAHEINTPIGNSVTSVSHLLMLTSELHESFVNETIKKSELIKYFQVTADITSLILYNLKKAADLILSFKKLTYMYASNRKRLFKIKEHITQVFNDVYNEYQKEGNAVTIVCNEDDEIYSYPDVLGQIMTILLIHSTNYTGSREEKKEIIFDIAKNNNEIQFIYFNNDQEFQSYDPSSAESQSLKSTKQTIFSLELSIQMINQLVTQKLNGVIEYISYNDKGNALVIRFPEAA